VKCFDRIDHQLLLSNLRGLLGHKNEPVVELISSFLKTPIYDRHGKNYANVDRGIGLPSRQRKLGKAKKTIAV
jgi:hypothetical protein